MNELRNNDSTRSLNRIFTNSVYLPNVLLLVTVPSTLTITTHRTSSPPCNNGDCWYLVFAQATEMVACRHKTNFAALDVSIGK